MKDKMEDQEIENEIWKVCMKNDEQYQYVIVTRKRDKKRIMCFSSGNVRILSKLPLVSR